MLEEMVCNKKLRNQWQVDMKKRNENIVEIYSKQYKDNFDKIFKNKINKPGRTYFKFNPETGKEEWMSYEKMMEVNPPKHLKNRRYDYLCDFVTDDITGKPLHIKGRKHLSRVLKENGMIERPPNGHRIRGARLSQGE